jgi:prepilin-type N-terminal cleavage/methylation domain-containing protein/prepilin-type processing-associated H-X9-DG protein
MFLQKNHRAGVVEHCRHGFTLLESLIVIGIISTLTALLIPAVQVSRAAMRRLECCNNIKQLALAALNHESAAKFLPTGGWNKNWLGHPDRGFGVNQPGGWIYNVLPFLEQQALHDLGGTGGSMTIEDANAERVSTPLAMLNCPSRRPPTLYKLTLSLTFRLTDGPILQLARNDYAMNAGDYVQWHMASPSSLAAGDDPSFRWNDMSHQTGLSHQRSQVTMNDIKDGSSNTFLIGEKCINRNHYTDGKDMGDCATMYCGGDMEVLRWTGYVGTIGVGVNDHLPRQDTPSFISEGTKMQWFGSAHLGVFNMSFCDGSVRSINYSIDAETFRCLGNRKDGLSVDYSQL